MRGTATLLAVTLSMAGSCSGQPANVREYAERCVDFYARQYEVPAALVRAIIQVESAWQPGAVSPKGAMGLMQLIQIRCGQPDFNEIAPGSARVGVLELHLPERGSAALPAVLQFQFPVDRGGRMTATLVL